MEVGKVWGVLVRYNYPSNDILSSFIILGTPISQSDPPLVPFLIQPYFSQHPPYKRERVFTVAPLALHSSGPPWTRTYCHPPQRLMVSVTWNRLLPALMKLLHRVPVVPKYPGNFQYVEVTVGVNHGTREMLLYVEVYDYV